MAVLFGERRGWSLGGEHAIACMAMQSPCNRKLARTCERGCARAQKTKTRVHASGSDDATSVPNAVNALTCSRVAHRLLTSDVDHAEFDRSHETDCVHAENCQLWEIALLQLFVGTACSIIVTHHGLPCEPMDACAVPLWAEST